MPKFSALVLVSNEEKHIDRCLRRLQSFTDDIVVVDSGSVDQTKNIAKTHGVRYYDFDVEYFYEKFNKALEGIDFKYDWVLRVDADEYIDAASYESNKLMALMSKDDVSALYVRRQLCFLGGPIRYGHVGKSYSMRMFRPQRIRSEKRLLDEQFILNSGDAKVSSLRIVDDPLITYSEWLAKHLIYAKREARQFYLDGGHDPAPRLDLSSRLRRVLRSVYYNLPAILRPSLYFFIRYVFLLGFLDGRRGFLFHFSHSFWYRLTIDLELYSCRFRNEEK